VRTKDIGGDASTSEFISEIVKNLSVADDKVAGSGQ